MTMSYHKYIAPAGGALAIILIGGAVQAAPPAAVSPGATTIDLAGEVTTAGVAGGLTDPVPLFSGASGPVIFVMGAPGIDGDTTDQASPLVIPAKPALNSRRAR